MNDVRNFTEFDGKTALQKAASEWIAKRLTDALTRRGDAVMMVSGGSTPGPIYRALSTAEMDWSAVTIGLTDERWVNEEHPASNGAMVRESLIANAAAKARFVPMKTLHSDAFEAVDALNERYIDAGAVDVMVVGMGPDGHTLSWFAGGRGYLDAVDPRTPSLVAAVEAIESDVTGPNTLRMTLTQPCVANARHVLLLITGQEKREVFHTAGPETPIGILRRAAGDALSIYYTD